MPQGLQIWDASGNLIIDATDGIAKLFNGAAIGSSYTGATQSGSFFDARFSLFPNHTPFVAIISGDVWNIGLSPYFTFIGNNVNWHFPHASLRPDTTFIYGMAG